jgi:hypothetical protein
VLILIEERERRPRNAFEQSALGFRSGEDPNTQQDTEQQAGDLQRGRFVKFSWPGHFVCTLLDAG